MSGLSELDEMFKDVDTKLSFLDSYVKSTKALAPHPFTPRSDRPDICLECKRHEADEISNHIKGDL